MALSPRDESPGYKNAPDKSGYELTEKPDLSLGGAMAAIKNSNKKQKKDWHFQSTSPF